MNAITLHDLTFTYLDAHRPALRNITLDVADNQIVGIVGRAGAGKSTLCALCAGFVPNFYQGRISGTASVDGQNVLAQNVNNLVRHVGLVSSNAFSQISGARFTVFEEAAFGLENLGIPRDEIIERVEWALNLLDIADLRDRSPYALSGGQQQRLVIAATLALRPPVLVLDDPTTQLDPPTTEQLATLLRSLAEQGTTIVFAEHRLEWAAGFADRIIALDDGQIIADGTPQEVFTNPLLLERQIGWPRPAVLAAALRDAGRWPTTTPLPVTVDALLAGTTGQRPTPSDTVTNAQRPTPSDELTSDQRPSPIIASSPHESSLPAAPIVSVENIRFAYPNGVEALRGVSMQIGAGERVALLGRNGAGKSTLVRHLNGLLNPSSGQVLVAGTSTGKLRVAQAARHVGIVFQNVQNQLFARSVRDELRFGPRNLGYPPDKTEALVEEALAALELQAFADTHPYDLPLAQRRLAAIAAVLTMDTSLLVLDEPTAGLDNYSIERLNALINQLAAKGKSVLVVSHDLDFCYEALDRVLLMRDGQMVLDTTWDHLAPQERATLETTVGLPIAVQIATDKHGYDLV